MTWKLHGAPCYLYVISEGVAGPVKVGIAAKPLRRLDAIQVGNPRHVEIAAVWLFVTRWKAAEVEGVVKGALDDHRIRGEWFDLQERDVCSFIADHPVVKQFAVPSRHPSAFQEGIAA